MAYMIAHFICKPTKAPYKLAVVVLLITSLQLTALDEASQASTTAPRHSERQRTYKTMFASHKQDINQESIGFY